MPTDNEGDRGQNKMVTNISLYTVYLFAIKLWWFFKKIQAFNIIQVSLRLEQWNTPSHTTTYRLYCVVTALTFCRWLTWHAPLVPRCGVYGSAVLWRIWFSPSPQGYVPLRHAQYHSAVDKDSRFGSQHLVFKFLGKVFIKQINFILFVYLLYIPH